MSCLFSCLKSPSNKAHINNYGSIYDSYDDDCDMPSPSPSFPEPKTNRNMGLVCVVTNAQNVQSYVIGTVHNEDKESIENSYFHQIIDRCSSVYTEAGGICYSFSQGANQREYRHIKYRFCLDQYIEQAAQDQGKLLVALDSDVPELSVEMHSLAAGRLACQNRDFEKMVVQRYMQKAATCSSNRDFVALHDMVKKGDVNALLASRDAAKPELLLKVQAAIREEHWARRLVPVLNNANRPICIAVGAFHLVGEGSLIDRFQKAGLKVEFIRHRSLTERAGTFLKNTVSSKLV